MMNLKEQLYVCTVAETGSTTAAAKKLHLSQPALTQYIQNLEQKMGIKLFDRVGKKFLLTYPGQIYVQKAQMMLQLKEEFEESLNDILVHYSSQMRFGIQNIYAPYLLPGLLDWMEQTWPNVKPVFMERRMAEMKKRLQNNELELLFGNLLFPDPLNQYTMVPLYQEHTVLAVAKGHPAAEAARKTVTGDSPWPIIALEDLQDQRFVLAPPTYKLRVDAENIFRHLELRPRTVTPVPQAPTVLQLIAAGYGIGFVQPSNVWLAGMADRIDLYRLDAPPQKNQFGAVTLKGRTMPDYAQDAIRFMGTLLQKQHDAHMAFYRK